MIRLMIRKYDFWSFFVEEISEIYVFYTFFMMSLKVPKLEIFDRSDFLDSYTIKSSWVGDLLVKILTYYFNF